MEFLPPMDLLVDSIEALLSDVILLSLLDLDDFFVFSDRVHHVGIEILFLVDLLLDLALLGDQRVEVGVGLLVDAAAVLIDRVSADLDRARVDVGEVVVAVVPCAEQRGGPVAVDVGRPIGSIER